MNKKMFMTRVGERDFIVETGHLAEQAGAAITLREGDTMVFAAATMSKDIREGIDFFPLSVDFEEKLYAAGRIPGSFFRRESRPPVPAILVARMADRPLRPLFPNDLRNEVQIVLMSLSHDQEHQHDILAINAASVALHISDIPWNGPVGAVRVGLIDGEFVVNPTYQQTANSRLDLKMSGTKDAINMVECMAYEVNEAEMIEALKFGHQAMQPFIELQERMREQLGKPKREYVSQKVNHELTTSIRARIEEQIHEIVGRYFDRDERREQLDDLRDVVISEYEVDEALEIENARKQVTSVFDDVVAERIRTRILEEGIRPDGRDTSTIRELSAQVGMIPRTHGSGLFQRGQTQVLSLATLGTIRMAQELDGLEPEKEKRYMHHYNFPPYSTGETWMLRGAKRREIGHGMLGENALIPVLPSQEDFPYTIRVVSEVMSSNGSTSQASICGSTLALMDAGVPIKRPVAGIAMGLISDGQKHRVLTDIQGLEDHIGDMDFKVAGTREGITALQMDIKISGLSYEVLAEALGQAHDARLKILDVMTAAIPEPRPDMSPFAPRMTIVQIDPEKIRNVIGKGGETIRSIQSETNTEIHIEEDGRIYIAAVDGSAALAAKARIEALTESADPGRIYTGTVKRVESYGAFVEIIPGTEGMVHISQLDTFHIDDINDVVKVGDEIMVMVTAIGGDGKIRLSRQAVLEGWTLEEAQEKDGGGRPAGGRSSDRGGDRRGGDRRGGNDRGGDRRGGGDRKPRE